ncbi:hypothetical protein GCK32_004583 [Trichostrongylus colubriformis]|uniref:Uncharacterized protein n=1 Tax=Trichostrongylus colubriformis TaxID=6319 RepID=A0AAN8IKY1_TRICO
MTSPIAKSVWVNLYKQLNKEASKFPQYNYREFAKRRIREHFEANRGVSDPAHQEELLKVGLSTYITRLLCKMRECAKCKSNEYTNKNLVMMVNECGHPLCKFECIVCNLAYGIDVEETEAEIATFKETHADLIERNKKKLDEDQLWIMQNLKEDREMKNRVDQAHNQENKEVERSAVKDTKAIMEELRESNVPAEVILDRERKRQIEQELEEKEEAARRKKRNKGKHASYDAILVFICWILVFMIVVSEILQDRKRMAESMSFSTSQRMSGRAFEYNPPRLLINGPPLPSKEELEAKGYLQHIRAASLIQAWTLCDRILCERRDPLACCFAAQTLRQKIMKSLSELPKDAYFSLRESLISHLSHIDVSCHDQVADATATQLCLAVADLYIQVPEWKNWVNELLQRFSALEGDRTRMLLTLLRVFSEEVQYSKVGENRRNEIRSELAASGASVIAYLSQVLEGYAADHDMIKKVLLCLSAYLQNPALSTDQFAASPLLNNVFQILAAPNAPNFLHDAATECAVSALVRAEDHHSHQALAMSLQAAVYQLHGAFNQAVANEDMDKSVAFPMSSACTILIMHLPEDGIRLRLGELCQPIIQRLQLVLSSTPVIPTNNENEKAADSWARIAGEPVLWIDRIATIFREVRPWNGSAKSMNGNASEQAPWLEIATQLYGVLSESLKRYESTSRVVEHCCRSIRFIVRSLGVQSIGFVEPLITQMMEIFSRHQHSCFLYLSSILVDEYGGMESLQPGLMIMLETLAHGTFTVLTLENGPRDHPDTVDDLFRLAMRFVTRAPSAFFTHTVATALFECAMVCLSLDHQEANRSVTRFFVSIIEQLLSARKTGFRDAGVEAAEDLVIHHGAKLIELCLHAAIFKVTGSLRRDLAEIVYMLSKIDRGRHKEWLITATSHLPRGPLAATDEQLEQFVANITADPERISLRDVHTQIRDLIKLYE